jgi:hypothetical protein
MRRNIRTALDTALDDTTALGVAHHVLVEPVSAGHKAELTLMEGTLQNHHNNVKNILKRSQYISHKVCNSR